MPPSAEDVHQSVCHEVVSCLDGCVERIKHCVEQLSDEQLWWRPQPAMNSIGNLVLHLSGNVRQWIVSGIGGAADDRDRPAEFAEQGPIDRVELLARLDRAVAESKSALADASAADLLASRIVQGFAVTGWGAIFDSVPHFKGHTQEIACLTRMQLGDEYRFFWQPTTPEEGAPP